MDDRIRDLRRRAQYDPLAQAELDAILKRLKKPRKKHYGPRVPSADVLQRILTNAPKNSPRWFQYRPTALLLRRVLDGRQDPEFFQSARVVARYDKNEERLILAAANEILEGYGVEVLRCQAHDQQFGEHYIDYINFGDVYNTTLMYDGMKRQFFVSSTGDFIEQQETRPDGCRFNG